jgi:2-isopropylmalate synthase
MITDAACGNGPVNALFNTIDRITGNKATLEHYTLKSVTRSSEALGEATIKLRCEDGRLVVGKGFSTDVIEASAKAYINALAKKSLQAESSMAV